MPWQALGGSAPPAPPAPPAPAAFVQPTQVPCFSTDASGMVLVISAAGAMFAAGLVLWLVVLRRRFPHVYFFKPHNRRPTAYRSWATQAWSSSFTEFEELCGLDAALYLRTQAYLMWFLGLLSVVTTLHDCLFQYTTAVHIAIASPRLWPMVAVTCLTAAATAALLFRIGDMYLDARRHHLARKVVQNQSVYMLGLPTSVVDPAALATALAAHFRSLDTLHAWVAIDWYAAASAYRRLDAARAGLRLTHALLDSASGDSRDNRDNDAAALEHAPLLAHSAAPPPRTISRCICRGCCCVRVDAGSHFEDAASDAAVELRATLLSHTACGTGVGFATFATPRQAWRATNERFAATLARENLSPDEASIVAALEHGSVAIRMAPDPQDIIWDNLSVSWSSKKLRQAANYAILIALMLFWQIPVGLLLSLNVVIEHSSAFSSLGDKPGAHMVFAYLIPSLLLIGFRVGLPYILMALAVPERFHFKSTMERAVLKKYFWFLIANTLVLPMLVTSTSSAASQLHDMTSKDVLRRLAASLGNSSSFFMSYVIIVTLVVTVARFFRTGPILLYLWKTSGKYASLPSDALASLLGEPEAFEYYVEWVDGISIFTVALTYATIAPLIVPTALMYFVCKHFADRYNLLFVHPKSMSREAP
ncbi:uncharacterized protein AMSG_12035 [Thecamonas trahens ATCC 50062]|uniref:CSC1/OSCA1-like 7TM region domain-containing protein n=1 Tax=Thecamonas trahens ATCC 50062 TaxID=461836 RepID=A0A0L0DFL6_THETB|nr:hypothetical protein AMSG_12035 [Thecamonas trahens ATCC 50062]KNC51079.1 hypothetical protein AMSG_12035 [Thecamonas trahens ATCC 50062]|eukprot:XP_013756566.1 hypothetical protein AMSG_12035 [Thecamonas trahens ATCC 50062]